MPRLSKCQNVRQGLSTCLDCAAFLYSPGSEEVKRRKIDWQIDRCSFPEEAFSDFFRFLRSQTQQNSGSANDGVRQCMRFRWRMLSCAFSVSSPITLQVLGLVPLSEGRRCSSQSSVCSVRCSTHVSDGRGLPRHFHGSGLGIRSQDGQCCQRVRQALRPGGGSQKLARDQVI